MGEPREFQSFEEFWPFYVTEHKSPVNRALHFVGTSAAVSSAVISLLRGSPVRFLLSPVFGYGPAWVGHFLIEKNRPATFKYPLWSLRGDFVMWWKMATGKMQAEVEAAEATMRARAEAQGAGDAPAQGDGQAWN